MVIGGCRIVKRTRFFSVQLSNYQTIKLSFAKIIVWGNKEGMLARASLLFCRPEYLKKNPLSTELSYLADALVGVLGLEPRMTGPESVVLPLHHTPN